MTRRKVCFMSVALGLLMFAFVTLPANASIVGNVYYFGATWVDQTFQENGGPIYQSKSEGAFKITVFNVTEVGGDDVYEYNYNGFDWIGIAMHVDHNDTVEFQDNKVYFDLSTTDGDADNRSESADVEVYPAWSFTHHGRHAFVNPVWSTHETDWGSAATSVESNPTVSYFTHNMGDGSFSFQIVVEVEDTVDVDGTPQDVNGTHTFIFSGAYDSDGIMSSWSLSAQLNLQNENYTSDQTVTTRVARTSGLGGPIVFDSALGTILVAAGAAGIVALVAGLAIGKRRWG
ncbi:MAG: hypothetical protein JSW05_11960 [Candidatus Thorarchaeota archaeon]|nr:MAG: hypothetical protein JSW05_11960 [Candidatus Thorarchaeota archaeon]